LSDQPQRNPVKVSVVIPLYNKASYIKRALDSVFTQTIQDFEIIVIDDGSTDNGHRIVEAFSDTRLRFFRQDNQGVSSARNRGVDEARAELIAFLDADDEWLPSHLETILRLRDTYPVAGAYTDAYLIHSPDGKLINPNYRAIPPKPWEGELPRYFLSMALGDSPVNQSVIGIRKTIFIEMNGYPKGIWFGEDATLWAKIAISYPIVFSWNIGAIYHWDCPARLCTKEPPLEEAPFIRPLREFLETNTVPPSLKADIEEYITRYEMDRAFRLINRREPEQGRKILRMHKTRYRRFEWAYGIFLSLLPPAICMPIGKIITDIRQLIIQHTFRIYWG
jgi:glycosyltransferase involved in cell wall biosynthesis